jgi:uncharacterized protein
MATRREFLAGAASITLTAGTGDAHTARPRLMSAAHIGDADGGVLWCADALTPFKLPARGHALTLLNSGKVALMGRRPGLFASIVDPADVTASLQVFQPSVNCRFAGHAAASPDESKLVTSEFDVDSVEAALVARDPANGAERARWNLNEIEPHEVLFARKGARLVAALGGLIKDGGVTGPAFNPGGVKSAVLEIDPKSGTVLARHALAPPLASLSLRHLAQSPDGETIAIAAQDQDLSETRPLVGLLALGKELEMLPMPDARDVDFRGYIGSIAFDMSGAFIAAASPRGSMLGLWSSGGTWCGALPIADVCGVTSGAEAGTFWASSGHGGIYKIGAEAKGPRVVAQWHADAGFDNHLILI